MRLMSPQQLNDDPKRWLDVPHELHESLLKLQEKLFPGFAQKLKDAKVHCFLCEGRSTFEVFVKLTGERQICDGYIGNPREPKDFFFHCVDPTK